MKLGRVFMEKTFFCGSASSHSGQIASLFAKVTSNERTDNQQLLGESLQTQTASESDDGGQLE